VEVQVSKCVNIYLPVTINPAVHFSNAIFGILPQVQTKCHLRFSIAFDEHPIIWSSADVSCHQLRGGKRKWEKQLHFFSQLMVMASEDKVAVSSQLRVCCSLSNLAISCKKWEKVILPNHF
jgi:hypothetical protein